ncbi:hypothetical protein N7495_006826 [Penicillium taxi]|uniref:uncharacterized protein n=1 Tax=Penicillium taxi TaxID=168475 RepID=UPI002545025D|nr:uncharacterized protein N7495_006826 [Penicillium taxi]KAJ5895135.1 hypothetical protein N7495_006826 [Penicillium taxi]
MSGPNADRKAAAALSSFQSNGVSSLGPQGWLTVDQDALGKAMSRLDISDITGHGTEQRRGSFKINPADVTFLIDNLDLNETLAIDLLKAYDGDLATALRAFMDPRSNLNDRFAFNV